MQHKTFKQHLHAVTVVTFASTCCMNMHLAQTYRAYRLPQLTLDQAMSLRYGYCFLQALELLSRERSILHPHSHPWLSSVLQMTCLPPQGHHPPSPLQQCQDPPWAAPMNPCKRHCPLLIHSGSVDIS